MRQEDGLWRTAKNALLVTIVRLVLRHPQFVKQVTTVRLDQVTLNPVQLEHSTTIVVPTIWKTAQPVLLDGTVMHKVYPFHEHNVTLAMSVMVEHTQEHQLMVSQADLALRGHSVSQVLSSSIPVLLGHTVRALVVQVTRIVSSVILATTALRSS